jgi:hypothetical protein
MPKMPNVTAADLTEANEGAMDIMAALHDLSDRIEKGYVDDIEKPVEVARTMISLSTAASTLAGRILFKLAMDEQRKELEQLLTARLTALRREPNPYQSRH